MILSPLNGTVQNSLSDSPGSERYTRGRSGRSKGGQKVNSLDLDIKCVSHELTSMSIEVEMEDQTDAAADGEPKGTREDQ